MIEMIQDQGVGILLLVLGFGFVIFWHELGHFLAAKWAGVRVEQFAVGFGQAMLAWRKGIGLRVGSTQKQYAERIGEYLQKEAKDEIQLREKVQGLEGFSDNQIERACQALGLGETEYRLNWIPLGGYVKMLGQDDLRPNAVDASPRAFNMKPVGKRMVIVSAGVIMNIILAMALFAILFRMGFRVWAPVVGGVVPLSPAQHAVAVTPGAEDGLKVGDIVQTIDGQVQHDFNKIVLAVALARNDQAVPITVRRPQPDGSYRDVALEVRPTVQDRDSAGFLIMGIQPSPELFGPTGLTEKQIRQYKAALPEISEDAKRIGLDEQIIAINGQPIPDRPAKLSNTERPNTYFLLDQVIQQSAGKPVTLTVKSKDGATREERFDPEFRMPFDNVLSFAGMIPSAEIQGLAEESTAKGKLEPDDVIVSIEMGDSPETVKYPSVALVRKTLETAGAAGQNVTMQVLRKGELLTIKDLSPTASLGGGRRGLGISLNNHIEAPVIGEVQKDSAAAKAFLPVGARILSIQDQPVSNWFDVWNALRKQTNQSAVAVAYESPDLKEKTTVQMPLAEAEIKRMNDYLLDTPLALPVLHTIRHTDSLFTAGKWGVEETRDMIMQFYVTLQRMVVQGTISPKNMMGPVGIFKTGAMFANRGNDWLIWFLAMISANLAVVNFLPIPIVDGGLFVFLIIEKLRGKPVSPGIQTAAQVVGLMLLLSVLVFVTYNDFTR